LNDESSVASGYMLGLLGPSPSATFSATIGTSRSDGLLGTSLSVNGVTLEQSMSATLFDFARNIALGGGELRLYFEDQSVWAVPTSFSPVPLPAAAWLLAAGLPMLFARRARSRRIESDGFRISRH
jgi:hypothetical protein